MCIRPPPCGLAMCQHKHNTISNYYTFCDGDGTTTTRIRITLNCNLSSNKNYFRYEHNTFQTPDHAGERDYEALLLAHGLVDTIEKHDGNVNFILSTKGVETLCRIGTAVLSMVTGNVAPSDKPAAKEDDGDKLISKKEVKQMLGVCDTTLWTWAKRKYLVPVKIGSRSNYRLSDVKRIMEG